MFESRRFHREQDKYAFETMLRKRGDNSVVDFTYFPPTGVIVFFQGSPIVIGFMVKCDNNTVVNTGIMSDPDFPPEVRNQAVVYLREVLAEEARIAGYKYVIAETNQPKLVEKLKEQGYTELQTNITQLGRVLWP